MHSVKTYAFVHERSCGNVPVNQLWKHEEGDRTTPSVVADQ